MITCPRCNRSSANLRSLLVHLAKVHSNEPHFRIVCKLPKPIGSCCSVFSSLASYKIHINRFHSRLLMSDKWENSSLRTEILCSVCNAAVHSLQGLSSHYKEHCTDGVSVPCVVRHCRKTFSVYSSYTSHMSRSHKNVSLCHIRDELKRQETVDYQSYDSESALDVTSNVELEEISDMRSMTKNIALLFMKLKAQYCLPDSIVQAIVSDFSDVCDVSSSMIKQRIRHLCCSYNLPPTACAEFDDAADCFSWNSARTELSSDWKRNSYYRREFPYVAPCEYKFVDECKNTDVYQYVSIIDTLKAVLQNEEVRAQVLNPCETAEGHLRTFRDGTLYKQHAVFSQAEHCLEIVLYSDEFEVVNPLGPHKKKHKITSFYFCLGNLQSSCKSLKSSIFCWHCAKACIFSDMGIVELQNG